MKMLKSDDFRGQDTLVYGCGVQNKTDRGYHRAVDLAASGLQFAAQAKAAIMPLKMANEPTK